MPEAYTLPIDSVIVGERRREDYGDIDGLAKSIAKYGLLHPVVIDEDHNLVAGERRLRALQSLGWNNIPVRSIGDLTEAERREIELEENLQRKDLSAAERSRTIVRYVETIQQNEGLLLEANKSPQLGRPSKGALPQREIEERTGIDRSTISQAQTHVAALDRYPELESFTQADALVAAKTLDTLPEVIREEARESIRQNDADTLAVVTNRPLLPKTKTPHQLAAEDPGSHWLKSLHDLYVLTNSTRDHGGIQAISARWSDERKREYIGELGRIQQVLASWVQTLEEGLAA